jgi:putative FmdB family regulatory protein
MPIYEYRCEACGHTLDWLQKVSDEPLKDCPECKAPKLKRLISAPAFRLSGSGWYETDFKSDKEKKRNLAEAGGSDTADKGKDGEKSKSEGKDGDKSKSDVKDAKKPDSKSETAKASKSDKKPGSEAA